MNNIKMKRFVLILLTLLLTYANTWADEVQCDTIEAVKHDAPRKLSLIRRIIRGFDRLDKNYIEPQHYLFTTMLQASYIYDIYTVRGGEEQTITFAPDASLKIGPYIGWKWIFGGYTFDMRNLTLFRNKQEWDLSIYSSQIGIDLFYRRTGRDYKLRVADFGDDIDTAPLDGISFNGVKAGITGVNLYYIFNHGHFSYPAAFAQSTCQKVSCGSWMAGIGYTKNTLDLDYVQLQDLLSKRLAPQEVKLDSGLMFNSVRYNDLNISAGYGYNWVFSPDWLIGVSGQMALAYKKTVSDMDEGNRRGFDIDNINVNGIGRFGIVYNNIRWYTGFSAIVRMNNYHKHRFSTSNIFGTMNLYVGYNFGLRKKYRNK